MVYARGLHSELIQFVIAVVGLYGRFVHGFWLYRSTWQGCAGSFSGEGYCIGPFFGCGLALQMGQGAVR